MSNTDNVLLGALAILGTVFLITFVTGWITMVCWNYTLPYLFGFKSITYLQGFALNMLGNLFFKSTQTNKNK